MRHGMEVQLCTEWIMYRLCRRTSRRRYFQQIHSLFMGLWQRTTIPWQKIRISARLIQEKFQSIFTTVTGWKTWRCISETMCLRCRQHRSICWMPRRSAHWSQRSGSGKQRLAISLPCRRRCFLHTGRIRHF